MVFETESRRCRDTEIPRTAFELKHLVTPPALKMMVMFAAGRLVPCRIARKGHRNNVSLINE